MCIHKLKGYLSAKGKKHNKYSQINMYNKVERTNRQKVKPFRYNIRFIINRNTLTSNISLTIECRKTNDISKVKYQLLYQRKCKADVKKHSNMKILRISPRNSY
jgi:hypothetical protein